MRARAANLNPRVHLDRRRVGPAGLREAAVMEEEADPRGDREEPAAVDTSAGHTMIRHALAEHHDGRVRLLAAEPG